MQVRFIFPALLLFNVPAAAGLARCYQNRNKSRQRRLLWLAAMGLLAAGAAATAVRALASRHNYPGGYALQHMHSIVENAPEVIQLLLHTYDAPGQGCITVSCRC